MKSIIPEWLMPRLKFKALKEEDSAQYPPLDSICYKDQPCGDCGVVLSEQRIVEIRRLTRPHMHWQSHCKACGKYQNPETLEYNLTNQELRATFYPVKKKTDKY